MEWDYKRNVSYKDLLTMFRHMLVIAVLMRESYCVGKYERAS
jgi:hypothetical protein